VTSQNGNNTSQSPSPYRLWKFIDQRDPRYRRFVSSSNSDRDRDKPALMMGTDWCDGGDRDKKSGKNTSTVAVLYIPGHGGSYEQSRSLGAHGLQLTGARNVLQERRVVSALQRNEWSGATSTNTSTNTSTDIDNFIFDVYAVDFGEEGGGLHGDLILEQGLFVGQAVQKLVQDCQLQDIVLVGHSMGGFAARLASILVPETRPHIRNIVTLATPHAGAWNPSLFHIHEHMKMMTSTSTSTSTVDTDSGDDNDNKNSNTVQQNTALISIAGGLRDEMILPEACHVNAAGAMTVRTRRNMRHVHWQP
jgi:triacylglycerol esterase/lipase EstA (alpha/beta hydrolase family)